MPYLSESLEDYLVDIFEEASQNLVARVKDIAMKRKVKLPSVLSAIKSLQERNLIRHQRYGYIVLTEEGMELAKRILERKRALLRFLTDTLGLPEEIAIKDAHKMEHDLSPQAIGEIIKLWAFFDSNPQMKESFRDFSQRKEAPMRLTLKDLKVSESGRIVEVAEGTIKNRLLSLGAIPGTVVKVEKVAPLGDPIDVSLLGYHLTLRKEEAEKIIVEKI
ncbi:MAG: DtxR family transcriptional regulator [bacterium]